MCPARRCRTCILRLLPSRVLQFLDGLRDRIVGLGLLTVGLRRNLGVIISVLLPLMTKSLDFASGAGLSLSYCDN
jgi:hypothetical protein